MISGAAETDPSVTGHVKWHPSEEWWFGTSFGRGPYLQDDAKPTLPPGKHIDDYDQVTYGVDFTYEHRSIQIWSELVHAKFTTPGSTTCSVAKYRGTATCVGSIWHSAIGTRRIWK